MPGAESPGGCSNTLFGCRTNSVMNFAKVPCPSAKISKEYTQEYETNVKEITNYGNGEANDKWTSLRHYLAKDINDGK